MRDPESGFVDDLVAVEQQVEVDRPRAARRCRYTVAAEPQLEIEQVVEQIPRARSRPDHRDPVQKPRFILEADWLGLAKRREQHEPRVARLVVDRLDCPPDRRLAIT